MKTGSVLRGGGIAAISLVALAWAAPAASAADTGMQLAQASAATYSFAIAAKPLAQALDDFGRVTGLSVVYTTGEPASLTAPAVSGRLSADQALRQLLAGSGLAWRFTDAKTVTLEKVAAEGAMVLDPVNVEGARPEAEETAWGPVKGYVAKRSASGTKTDTPILETPQSISVVTAEQMEAQGVSTLTDALRYTAGVNVQPFGVDNRFDWLNIRGFDASAFTYRDGLGTSNNQLKIEPYGLERVEILKGPASVLYGQIAPGGLVNLISKRPQAEARHEVGVDVGSFDSVTGKFDMTGPLDAEGHWLYRAVGLARDGGTQVDHTPDDRKYFAPSLTWRPDSDTSLTMLAEYRKDETRYPQGFPVAGTLRSSPYGAIESDTYLGEPGRDHFNRTQYALGYILDHRLNAMWSVHQSLRYSHYDYDLVSTNATGLQADGHTINRIIWVGNPDSDVLNVDNRANAKFATGPVRHDVLFGLDHGRSRVTDHGTYGAAPTIDLYNPVYGNAGTIPADASDTLDTLSQTGLYAQDQLKFDDHWVLTLGGRHDWAHSESEDRINASKSRQSDSKFTWRSGLSYLFESGLAPYVSYATSFQPTAGTDFGGSAFKPTTGRQYELGAKFQPKGFNSFITASVFEITQQNVLTTDTAHPLDNIQTGEVRTRGAELEGTASLTEGLNLIGSYTYLDARITKSNNGDEGLHQQGIPRHAAALWADYTQPDGPLAGLGGGAGVRYVGATFDNTNTLNISDYALYDGTVHYDWEGLRLALTLRNVTDKKYISSCAWDTCYFGDRRTVLGSVTFRW